MKKPCLLAQSASQPNPEHPDPKLPAEPSQPKEPRDGTPKYVLSPKFWDGFLKENRFLQQAGKENVIIFHNPSCTVIP